MAFVHLHTHSNFSFLDGATPLRKLVERTRELGMTSLALTDHNGLYGAVMFYRICQELGVKAIIGSQLTLTDGSTLVLLVKNQEGYGNLCRLVSQANLRGGHLNFECDIDTVSRYRDGLVVLSGGKKGLISRLVQSRNFEAAERCCRLLLQHFGSDFFLEVQRFLPYDDLLNERLCSLARKCAVPLVASNDVHMLSPRDVALRQVLHAIAENTLREHIQTTGYAEQYLKSPAQMRQQFAGYPEALANTEKIAGMCRFDFSFGKPIFPVIRVPSGETSASHLRKLCLTGAAGLYRPLTDQVKQRIDYELAVIDELGFTDYFLIVHDIVAFCRRESIPCVGRGSAGDSIVSYVLGITFADPIRFDLYFERFLNPERTDAPDIDLDICWKNRDRVIEYVYDRFGRDKTAMICTYNTFQSRSAMREVAKVFGLPEEEIGQLTREFPYMSKLAKLDDNLANIPGLRQHKINHTYREIIAISKQLADFPRHLSIHAGGVIIAPAAITHHTPLEVAGKGIVISQYDMHSIERLGLVKMDLLGVRSLSIITECLERARAAQPATSNSRQATRDPRLEAKFAFLKKTQKLSPLDLRAIPEDDPETIKLIRSGQTLGCFQLESPLVRGVLRKMQTDSIEDTVVAVAVIRPGVGDSGMKDEYILRRGGVAPSRYLHPVMEPVLKGTHGVTIYQEQILLIAQAVAGFSLAQADTLRRAMTKNRDDQRLMQSMRCDFIAGARRKGIDEQTSGKIWQFILHFCGFGFNKAHAATYGILAYQTAFLKRYFPVEYMTAVLNNHGGFYSTAVYIEECRRVIQPSGRRGIAILPPDVNRSDSDFSHEGNAIRVGLYPIFDLTERMKQQIRSERKKQPFVDLFDFLHRTGASQKETEHLIRCGAMRALHPSEPLLLIQTQTYFKNGRSRATVDYVTAGLFPQPYSWEERMLAELELMGFAVAAHPLSLYDGYIPWENMVPSSQLEAHKNQRVQFTGWYVTSRLQRTVKGQYMKFLSLEDKNGVCETIFFPPVYERYAHVLQGLGPFTVIGRVQSRIKGEANLIAERVVKWMSPKEIVAKRREASQQDASRAQPRLHQIQS
jgi:DNA-directed DNA polymerase III PolC